MVWTLRKKILIGYGIALALMALVLGWAFVNLLSLGRASDAILRENYGSILAAENMVNALERQDSATLLMVLGYGEGLSQVRENESQFLQWLGRAKDNITIEGEEDVISAIDAGYTAYLVNVSELSLLCQTDSGRGADFYHQRVLPSFKTVRQACVRLRELNQEIMFGASSRARLIAGRAMWSMLGIGAAALGLGLGFSLLLSNLLVRPLRQVMEAARRIAEGSYDVKIATGSSDELGSLANEFNTMAKKLRAYRELNVGQIVAEKHKGEALIRSIDDGIVVVDAELKVTDLNPTAARALDVQPDKVLHKHFLEVVKSEELFNYVKATAETGQPPPIAEGQNVFTVGEAEEQRHYQFSVTPVRTGAGSMLGVVLLLRDVTRLKELDRLKSEFVMTASHELRTPLTSIGMSVDLLLESAVSRLNEKENQLLQAAHEDLERLKALVSDLLDLSKIEAGKMVMDLEPVTVRLLFEKAVSVFKGQADERGVALGSEPSEGLPDVRADANKIVWVLTNLISNALRYTGRGGYIRLSAEQVGSRIHLSVKDNGAGIPYEHQSKIFDKFVQVGGDRGLGGSGLGLAICREIVRAHGGTIWVDSAPGEGSTFTFTLQLAA